MLMKELIQIKQIALIHSSTFAKQQQQQNTKNKKQKKPQTPRYSFPVILLRLLFLSFPAHLE